VADQDVDRLVVVVGSHRPNRQVVGLLDEDGAVGGARVQVDDGGVEPRSRRSDVAVRGQVGRARRQAVAAVGHDGAAAAGVHVHRAGGAIAADGAQRHGAGSGGQVDHVVGAGG